MTDHEMVDSVIGALMLRHPIRTGYLTNAEFKAWLERSVYVFIEMTEIAADRANVDTEKMARDAMLRASLSSDWQPPSLIGNRYRGDD